MQIVKIDAKDFNRLTKDHPQVSFHQTSNWAKLKEITAWIPHYIGYQDDQGQYKAFAMILAKKMPLINKYLFYSPHGYLIDYTDKALLSSFHKDLVAYLKKENAFEIIIDPYFEYTDHDINGDVIGTFKHDDVIDTLTSLNYKHTGFNLYYENLQPRWLFRLNVKERPYTELFKDFRYEVKRRSKRKDFLAIKVRELKREEIPVFKDLMNKTADRRGFIDRPLRYYEQMYDAMHDDGILRYMVAEIDFNQCKENVLNDNKRIEEKIQKLLEKNTKKTANLVNEEKIILDTNNRLLKAIEEAHSELGEKVALSGVCLLTYGQEAVMLLAGNDEKYLQDFSTSYIIVTELIQLVQNEGYTYYNFYGITGDFNPKNEHYGLYLYKKQYGGEVVELIGQFTYTVDPFIKALYNMAMKVYNLRKGLKH